MRRRGGSVDVYFEVDSGELTRKMRHVDDAIERLVMTVSMELAEELESEGGQVAAPLGDNWNVERGVFSATVQAPSDAWWAHFLARGTRAHGPKSESDRLVFTTADNGVVSADFVAGITANPFDDRALARTRGRVDDILRRLMR
jgi:hypothetical protein